MFFTLLVVVSYAVGYYVARKTQFSNNLKWRTVFPPEGEYRGPNADTSYKAIKVDGKEVWFTNEQVADAEVRGDKYTS